MEMTSMPLEYLLIKILAIHVTNSPNKHMQKTFLVTGLTFR